MSTTLTQLGVTLGAGCGVLAGTLLLFAGALTLQITHIAPRCEARPRNVIYNPLAFAKRTTAGTLDRRKRHVQDRGNPLWGWILWLVQLSYHTLIEGVPGTGTRNDGIDGHLLKLNLDAIVMLRFHALGLRITCFAMFVYCCIVLPIYYTSRCFDPPYDPDKDVVQNENCTLDSSYNLTLYERMTLANVPPLNEAHVWDTSGNMIDARLYGVVICTYIVAWYTCYELHKEWIDLLAMRRIYYLEKNIWKARREELKATMLYDNERDDDDSTSDGSNHNNGNANSCGPRSAALKHQPTQQQLAINDNPYLYRREAWIPHPEQRDTPPNIALYSVLVGGLPQRPSQAVTSPEQDLEAAETRRSSVGSSSKLDWQLSVTSAFFDYCVPNQPGYSSSVAAVTILPSAREMASAWKKWYGTTKKLQRLRFIRRQLLDRGFNGDLHRQQQQQNQNDQQYLHDSNGSSLVPPINDSERTQVHSVQNEFDIYLSSSSRRHQYQNEILGDVTDDDVEAMFLKSLEMGPEQTAVYSLELARGSSKCCPHGCCEEKIIFSSTEELLQMEAEAVEEANTAFLELEVIRQKAVLVSQNDRVGMFKQRADSIAKINRTSSVRTSVEEFGNRARVPGVTLEDVPTATEEPIENKLYGKGKTSLDKRNKQDCQKTPHGSSVTIPSSIVANASPIPKGQRFGTPSMCTSQSRLDTEDSAYFPSLIRMAPSKAESSDGNGCIQNAEEENDWQTVRRVANECQQSTRSKIDRSASYRVSDGIWHAPSLKLIWGDFWKQFFGLISWTLKSSKAATDLYARDSTYAVVTFTSRQAAIAARKCLADGRGAGKWEAIDEIPVPPLADASAFNICDCRGCCRPVTVTLNDHQKIVRNFIAISTVIVINVFYTFPITFASAYGSEQFTELFPGLNIDQQSLNGLIRGWLLNFFLAICPHMFLFLANFGSNATSMVEAEYAALQYYWWFFLIFALLGSSIAQMVLTTFQEGSFEFTDTLQRVAATIPVQVSSTWCNWVILKALILHPLFYLLQLWSFLFSCLHLKCCLRTVRGGGAGTRVPFRCYVDSGMVIFFALALAPAAPIVAISTVIYFVICNPILRHALIFTYKPHFDGGGVRWPFLFDACISSLLVSQILMGTMLGLKKAMGPAVLASLLVVPTFIFRRNARRRFLAAYRDAALLQTSLLDGWDTSAENAATNTMEGREEFRQFLVDAHKAAYVPVCVAGTNTDKIMTAEPAVVVPSNTDANCAAGFSSTTMPPMPINSPLDQESSPQHRSEDLPEIFRSSQVGAVMRRSSALTLPRSGSTPSLRLQRVKTNLASSVAKGNKFKERSFDESDSTMNISSLGLILENEKGETVHSFSETDKDA